MRTSNQEDYVRFDSSSLRKEDSLPYQIWYVFHSLRWLREKVWKSDLLKYLDNMVSCVYKKKRSHQFSDSLILGYLEEGWGGEILESGITKGGCMIRQSRKSKGAY